METNDFVQYGIKYPNLCFDLVNYFTDSTKQSMYYKFLVQHLGNGTLAKITKSSMDFANFFKKYTDLSQPNVILQPTVISKICDILCEHRILSKVHVAGINLILGENFYYRYGKVLEPSLLIQSRLNNIVYGFKYIYETNRGNICPIHVYNKQDRKQQTGTCIKTSIGIITARHCLENQDYVQIESVTTKDLEKAKIFTNDKLDLALIVLEKNNFEKNYLIPGKGEVLDDVIIMGYPNHAGFKKFLTATTGQIAAIETSYLDNHKLMLLTGKIKGGNSGGPVLNRKGEIVGIVTEAPAAEGEYDQFGYGLAIPSNYITELTIPFQKNFTFVNDINTCCSL